MQSSLASYLARPFFCSQPSRFVPLKSETQPLSAAKVVCTTRIDNRPASSRRMLTVREFGVRVFILCFQGFLIVGQIYSSIRPMQKQSPAWGILFLLMSTALPFLAQ